MIKSLELTLTVSPCLGCVFCAQEKLAAAYKSDKRKMSMADFETILAKLPKDTRIDASGFSECFLHPDAPQMLVKAKAAGHEVHVYSTLLGLTAAGAYILPKSIDYFRIHVPDRKGLIVPDKVWIKEHDIFRTTGITASYMSMGEPTPEVKCYLTKLDIVVDLPEMLTRAGNLTFKESPNHKGKFRCAAERWHQNVVLPNGDVVGCCMDYGCSVPLGNLLTQPYDEIYAAAEEWRVNMERDVSGICAHCEWGTPA